MSEGDLVWPSKINPVKFNKNVKFPWKIRNIDGLTVWLERPSKSGRIRVEKWYSAYWQPYPPREAWNERRG